MAESTMVLVDGEMVPEVVAAREAEPQVRTTTESGYAAHTGGVVAEVKSAAALLRHAGLDWQVEKRPLFLADGRMVDDRKAVCRADTGQYIGTVSAKFGLVQNSEMAALADAAIGLTGWTVGQAAAFNAGGRVWMQLRRAPQALGGLQIQDAVLVSNRHDGLGAMTAGFTRTWAVCRNTLSRATREAGEGLRLRHTVNVSARLAEATNLVEAAQRVGATMDNAVLRMMRRDGISTDHAIGMAITLFGESKQAEKQREAFLRAYLHAPGAAPGTAFGLLQATTYYTTHEMPVRQGSYESVTEARLGANWWGRGADVQAEAWGILESEEKTAALQTVRVVRRA